MSTLIFENKKILVVGLATSGIPTVNTLLALGAEITVNDMKSREQLANILMELENRDIKFILGKDPTELSEFDYVILSPGVPTNLPFIEQARVQGIIVMGELELAYLLCKGSFVAITGTNGKTTTTTLTGEIFKNANLENYVVGNIGIAAVSKALTASSSAVMVTEVSSFQLESIISFKPRIAAILNITPDHLNRHKTMTNYVEAKANIFMNQEGEDFLVLNADNELSFSLRDKARSKIILFSRKRKLHKGAFVLNNNIVYSENGTDCEIICGIDEVKIPGNHNLENALAAVAIARCAGINKDVIAYTLKCFGGVEHRLEYVDNIDGVEFINDSKGTNPDASIKAIEAIKTPVVLIAGGMDKGSNFKEFIHAFNGKVKHMVLIGETADSIHKTAEECGFNNSTKVKDMEEAVEKAFELACTGSTVLLSPACASWDMYSNFEVRGRHFKSCVEKLRRP